MVSIFGASFKTAGLILSIHLWSSLFVFLGVARGAWITTEGLMKFSMFSAVAGAAINILLNLILIPMYSGIGAAVATVISYAFSGYISSFFYYKTREVGAMMTKSILFPLYWLMGK
jgi:PST family polysaccharide transporter